MWIHVLSCCCCAIMFEISSVVDAEPWDISQSFTGLCQPALSSAMNRKVPRENGFHIRISGNPNKYLPEEMYTVILEGSRFAYQSFIGFMLIVEPKVISNDTSVLPDVGYFKFLADDLINYSQECPNAIVHVSLSPKHGIQVIWKAPKAGTGCVVFTAIVQENGDVWHKDEEGLILELCEKELAAVEGASLPGIEPARKCSVKYCTCAEIPQWNDIDCEDYSKRCSKRPVLSCNSSNYLPERMLLGLCIYSVILRNPNVTVAENVLEGMICLDKFIVYQSGIQVVPDFRFVKDSITNLYITSSCLTSLEGKNLQNLTSLLYLSFSKNSIRYIDADVFWVAISPRFHVAIYPEIEGLMIAKFKASIAIGTYDVYSLILSHNKLTSISPKLLNHMRNLQHFDASHNNLLHVDNLFAVTYPLTSEEYEFTGPGLLESVFLQHNQIKSIGTLQQLQHLFQLNIAHNDIKLIKPDQLPDALQIIYLAENYFKCDCYFQKFLIYLQTKHLLETDTNMCYQPSDVGRSLLTQPNCLSICSCRCIEYGNDSVMFVDCSSRNLYGVPHFLSDLLEDNVTISSVHQRQLLIKDNIIMPPSMKDIVIGMSLENNNLKFLDAAQLPPNLSELYLANNKLRWLPDAIFDTQLNLKQVSLSGNPWICNCYTLRFKKWLTSNRNAVLDINNTRCGISDTGEANLNGSVIWTLSDSDLCPSKDFILLLSVCLGVPIFIIICLSAKMLYEKYQLNIKMFLYYHGFASAKDEDMDDNKEFDAFISFSHEDDEFIIKEIISEIEERNPNIRLCLHYRHFTPGVLIHTNIIHAVQNSKMTLCFLSRNFLNSEWCLVEFRTAQGQIFEDKLHKIIVVKIDDLPKNMDPIIENFLKTTTYLTWGETNFWKKLLFVLPSGPTVRNHFPRNSGDNNTVFNCSFTEI